MISIYETNDDILRIGPNQIAVALFFVGLALSLTMELKGVFAGLELTLFAMFLRRVTIYGSAAMSSKSLVVCSSLVGAALFFLLMSNGDSRITAAMESGKVAIFFFSLFTALGSLPAAWLERLVLWSVWAGVSTGSVIQTGLNVDGLEQVAKHVSLPSYLLLLAWLGSTGQPALRLTLIPSIGAAAVAAATGETRSANGFLILGLLLAALSWTAPTLVLRIQSSLIRWLGILTFSLIIASVVVPVALAQYAWADLQYDPTASKSNVERSTMLVTATDSFLSNFHTGIGFDGGFDLLLRAFASTSDSFQATSSLHNMLFDAAFFGGFWISMAFAVFMTAAATRLLQFNDGSALSRHILGALVMLVGGMSVYAWSSQGRMYYLAIVLSFAGRSWVPPSQHRKTL